VEGNENYHDQKADKSAEPTESYRPISLLLLKIIREISTKTSKAFCNNREA